MTDKIREYRGRDIVVRYDVERCIHVAECVRGLPPVFDRNRRPWVVPDNGTADGIAAVILRCPSGALHFERLDGGAQEVAPPVSRVQVAANGPLYVHGDIEIRSGDGTVLLQDTRVALCRCGASRNKPFCDNSHLEIGFVHSGELGENRLQSDASILEGQKLIINRAPNGPNRLVGNVEIHSVDGQTVLCGNRVSLCRCGASKNKPFCDGSHRRIGFEAD